MIAAFYVQRSRKCRELNQLSIDWADRLIFVTSLLLPNAALLCTATACIFFNPDHFIFSLHFFYFALFFGFIATIPYPSLAIFPLFAKQRKKKTKIFIVNSIWNGMIMRWVVYILASNRIVKSINWTNPMPQISPINNDRRCMCWGAQLPKMLTIETIRDK